jgi:hypothetical protein
MGLTKCVCGRNTDFGNLCVFCSRDKLLDKADESTQPCTSDHEPEEVEDEEKE